MLDLNDDGFEDLQLYLFQSPNKTKEIGKRLLAKMPEELQSGSIFVRDYDWLAYLGIMMGSMTLFFALYPTLHLIIRKCKVSTY